MVRNEARAAHVRKLTGLAQTAGVEAVRKDDASRVLVTGMVNRIRGAGTRQAVRDEARAVPRLAFSTHPLSHVLSRAAPRLSRAVPQFVFYYTSAVPRLSRTLSRACAALSRGLFLPYIRCPARCPAPALSRAQLLWTWRIERPMRKIYIYSFIFFFLVFVWQLCQKKHSRGEISKLENTKCQTKPELDDHPHCTPYMRKLPNLS